MMDVMSRRNLPYLSCPSAPDARRGTHAKPPTAGCRHHPESRQAPESRQPHDSITPSHHRPLLCHSSHHRPLLCHSSLHRPSLHRPDTRRSCSCRSSACRLLHGKNLETRPVEPSRAGTEDDGGGFGVTDTTRAPFGAGDPVREGTLCSPRPRRPRSLTDAMPADPEGAGVTHAAVTSDAHPLPPSTQTESLPVSRISPAHGTQLWGNPSHRVSGTRGSPSHPRALGIAGQPCPRPRTNHSLVASMMCIGCGAFVAPPMGRLSCGCCFAGDAWAHEEAPSRIAKFSSVRRYGQDGPGPP